MSNTIDASKFSYVQFATALIALCEKLGLPEPLRAGTESGLPQNEGWCFLRFSENGAAIIIPKGKTRMAPLHSHVDLTGYSGYIALPKKNGKVVCHFAADLGLLETVLPLFVGASKRASLAPVAKTVATPVDAFLAAIPVAKTPVVDAPLFSEAEYEAEAAMYEAANS